MMNLEEVILPLEGLEALRLSDVEGFDHDRASEKMNVSRQTFGRILSAARKILAEAVVEGKALKIEGGNYVISGRGEEVIQARQNRNKAEDLAEG
jgi:predicted DNA-binding protein (UPF0251 family)